MKYAVLFLVLGPALVAEAVVCRGLYWLLLWPGISLTVVGLAYLRLGPGVFGKKPDGTLAWHSALLLLPYLLAAWAVWHVARIVGREDCCNEVAPGLFVGRRPLVGELPSQVSLVVDLAAEFIECRAVRASSCRAAAAQRRICQHGTGGRSAGLRLGAIRAHGEALLTLC